MQYYICPNCGDLTTSEEIDEEISCGGMDLCGCEYMVNEWNGERFDPIYYRRYINYVEIPQNIYEELNCVSNTVIRLGMYRSWRSLF